MRNPLIAGTLSLLIPGLVLTSARSEEHTSEFQSHSDLVCRLLLEKKKNLHCRSSYNRRRRTENNNHRRNTVTTVLSPKATKQLLHRAAMWGSQVHTQINSSVAKAV